MVSRCEGCNGLRDPTLPTATHFPTEEIHIRFLTAQHGGLPVRKHVPLLEKRKSRMDEAKKKKVFFDSKQAGKYLFSSWRSLARERGARELGARDGRDLVLVTAGERWRVSDGWVWV